MRAMSEESVFTYVQAICGGRHRLLRSDAPPTVIVASVCRFFGSFDFLVHALQFSLSKRYAARVLDEV